MSLPKLSVIVVALLLANLLLVAVSSVDPSELADTSDDDERAARWAMATINNVISEGEAQRSTPSIGDSVGAAWESGGATYLTPHHVDLITNYNTMCCAVFIARQNGGAWDSEEAVHLRSIGLFSEEDVLKELDLITWPHDCSVPITLDRNSM